MHCLPHLDNLLFTVSLHAFNMKTLSFAAEEEIKNFDGIIEYNFTPEPPSDSEEEDLMDEGFSPGERRRWRSYDLEEHTGLQTAYPDEDYYHLSQTLVPLELGVKNGERVGRKVWIRGVELRGTIQIPRRVSTSDIPNWDRIRVILFVNRQQNEDPTKVDQLLDKAHVGLDGNNNPVYKESTLSFYNTNSFRQFDIWSDKTYTLIAPSLVGDSVIGATVSHIHEATERGDVIHYSADKYPPEGARLESIIPSKNIQLIVLSETLSAAIRLNVRVYYTDGN